MTLYILRHAIAVPRGTPGYPNDDRPLTKEGRKKMESNALGIAALGISPDEIIASPLIRARDTAEIVSEALGRPGRKGRKAGVAISDLLLPGAAPDKIVRELSKRSESSSVMIVGHEPHLGLVASALLGAPGGAVQFKKGGLCRIDLSGSSGSMAWLLAPKHLRAIGEAGR